MTPALSVVIPTFNRRDALLHTLARLDAQSGPDAEILVVDNGSSDGTPDAIDPAAHRHAVTVLREPRPGPAAARNRGIAAARAEVVLLLGDDMAPAGDDLLAGHLARHARHPEPGYAVLGRAAWRPDRPVTPFMRWLEEGGMQFAFGALAPGPVAPERYLYTANVSLKRALLTDAGGFDERFPYAAVEDTELGLRLARRGVTLDYAPELLVHHDHPTPLRAAIGRMHKVGRSAALLHAGHPEVRGELFPGPRPHWPLYPALRPVAGVLARPRVPHALRRRAWSLLLWASYADGYRAGPPG